VRRSLRRVTPLLSARDLIVAELIALSVAYVTVLVLSGELGRVT